MAQSRKPTSSSVPPSTEPLPDIQAVIPNEIIISILEYCSFMENLTIYSRISRLFNQLVQAEKDRVLNLLTSLNGNQLYSLGIDRYLTYTSLGSDHEQKTAPLISAQELGNLNAKILTKLILKTPLLKDKLSCEQVQTLELNLLTPEALCKKAEEDRLLALFVLKTPTLYEKFECKHEDTFKAIIPIRNRQAFFWTNTVRSNFKRPPGHLERIGLAHPVAAQYILNHEELKTRLSTTARESLENFSSHRRLSLTR